MPKVTSLLCGTAILALLAGCAAAGSASGGNSSPGKPIIVGFATAQSGAFAAYDVPAVQGAEMEIAKINAAGGLDGHKIQVVSADTKTQIAQAQVAADTVLAKGAQFIMTTCDFDYGSPSALAAQAKDIVAMSSCAGSTKYRPAVFGPLAFSMATATPAEGATMAEFAYRHLHERTAYVLTDQSIDQTKEDAKAFTLSWQKLGGKIAGQDTFQQGDASFSAQITRIQQLASPPDAIWVSSYPPGGATMIRQLRAAGINSTILGDSNFEGSYWMSAVPGISNMYHDAFASITGDDPNPAVNAVIHQFVAKYHQQPTTSLGLTTGYSVMQAFARAYLKAKTTEGKALTRAFESFRNVPLLVGPTTFTTSYHITPLRPLRIIAEQHATSRFLLLWTPSWVPVIH
jgi:branched-chain amino acid transport system substrate-binding protein